MLLALSGTETFLSFKQPEKDSSSIFSISLSMGCACSQPCTMEELVGTYVLTNYKRVSISYPIHFLFYCSLPCYLDIHLNSFEHHH